MLLMRLIEVVRISFQFTSYPVVFSDDRILFIQVLITSNSRHKTTVLDRLKQRRNALIKI